MEREREGGWCQNSSSWNGEEGKLLTLGFLLPDLACSGK